MTRIVATCKLAAAAAAAVAAASSTPPTFAIRANPTDPLLAVYETSDGNNSHQNLCRRGPS